MDALLLNHNHELKLHVHEDKNVPVLECICIENGDIMMKNMVFVLKGG